MSKAQVQAGVGPGEAGPVGPCMSVSLGSCGGSSRCPVMRDPDLSHLSVKGKCILPCVFTMWGVLELREIIV